MRFNLGLRVWSEDGTVVGAASDVPLEVPDKHLTVRIDWREASDAELAAELARRLKEAAEAPPF